MSQRTTYPESVENDPLRTSSPSGIPAMAHVVVDALASGEKDRMVVRQIALYCSKALIGKETHGATNAGNFIR
jgi:hypothetical protein